jgi:uncharacterized ion transporter superfamily protein YfcC
MENKKKEKKSLQINPFVLIFCVVVVCGLLTFLITPGTLENGVYTALPKNAFNFNNLFNIMRAIPYGLKESANIVVLILVVGGALGVYKRTGAIDNGIAMMVHKFGKSSQSVLLVVLVVVFSAMGGFLGWVEVLIPFVPLVVAVVLALGYDSLTAVAVCICGAMGGFVSGPTNLYTVGVCNQILREMGIMAADSDVFEGLGFRVVLWCIMTAISVVYILVYANKVKKNPDKSYVAGVDVSDIRLDTSDSSNARLSGPQVVVLLSLLGAMIMTVIGMKFGFNGVTWVIDDVSGIFLLSAIISGLVAKLKPSQIADTFIDGAKGAIAGALIVGVARGVYWVLNVANVNATIIHYTTEMLRGTSPLIAAIGIVIIVSFINGLIPSGSGKGALLSPILVPIALELGLSAQTAVLAYQFGDGITNMFWFSYGTLLIWLNYGKVPIQKWWKFFVPLMLIFFLLAFVALGVAVSIGF